MENSLLSKPRSRFLLLGSILLFLLVVLFVLMISSQKKPTPIVETPQPAPQQATQQSTADFISNITQNALPAPQLKFDTWTGLTAPESLPSTATIYTLKNAFSYNEARAIAQKLDTDATLQTKDNLVMGYSFDNSGNDVSVVALDTSNGTFTYNSTTGVALPGGGTIEDKALQFVRDLGIYDPTIVVAATYKNRKSPGMTYVELHRSWDRTRLPILNAQGLLNIPENQALSALTVGGKTDVNDVGDNPDIYATTDDMDGYARKDDFNTLTLVIDEGTQRVKSAKSTLRVLATAAPTARSLISFENVAAKLREGQYDFIFTTPSGEGQEIPWERIYPQNMAEADSAVVQETIVAYLENPPHSPQARLEPYFVMRGNALLKNGYQVKFVAAVKATDSPQSALQSNVAGVMAQEAVPGQGGQQQTTFKLTPVPTRAGGINVGIGAPLPSELIINEPLLGSGQPVCVPATNSLNPIISINIEGITYYFGYGWRRDNLAREWFFIPTQTTLMQDSVFIANLSNIINYLEQAVENPANAYQPPPQAVNTEPEPELTMYQTNPDDTGQKQGTLRLTPRPSATIVAMQAEVPDISKFRKFDKIIEDLSRQYEYCPTRLTGNSPTVFVYGAEGAGFSVEPAANITYADPAITTGWHGTIVNGQLALNGVSREYLYYEYTDVAYDKPARGWNIKKNELETFVSGTLAPQIGFSAQESERALFELRHAADSVQADALFVGLLDQNVVDSKLPLVVGSHAHTQRYHFYVSAAGSQVQAPVLTPIVRGVASIVEIGSYASK